MFGHGVALALERVPPLLASLFQGTQLLRQFDFVFLGLEALVVVEGLVAACLALFDCLRQLFSFGDCSWCAP